MADDELMISQENADKGGSRTQGLQTVIVSTHYANCRDYRLQLIICTYFLYVSYKNIFSNLSMWNMSEQRDFAMLDSGGLQIFGTG